jgi:hypothetical protein
LFSHLVKRENERRVFWANLFGAKIKDEIDDIEYNGDPESVAHLSQAQKKELTKRLMAKHRKKFQDINLKQ